MRGILRKAAFVPALCLLLLGCGEDETETTSTTPTVRNPSLAITSPADDMHCFSIGSDPDARIPIQIETKEMVIRPPDFCGSIAGCGHFVLLVGDRENNIGSTRLLEVLMRKLADRYGTFEITVEARNDDNEILVDKSGESEIPARDTVTIASAPNCEAQGGSN